MVGPDWVYYITGMNHMITMKRIQHQLPEGILLRLARLPDAQQFILRGGMLLRHWFRPIPRTAADLDLVATFPFHIEKTGERFFPVLTDNSVNDGVLFNRDRYRVEGIWLNTNFPGVRIYVCGETEGEEVEFSIDVTFNEPLIPEPVLAEYRAEHSGQTAQLWMCRPETILGRKLHALKHMGKLHWRPKDLNDIRLLLQRVPMYEDDLPAAIVASFTSRGEAPETAKLLFTDNPCWAMKRSAARWYEFVRNNPDMKISADLTKIVETVSEQLQPILDRLP